MPMPVRALVGRVALAAALMTVAAPAMATGGFDDEEQKHGVWKRYHTNGQLWDEGRFEHGKKKGTWKVFDEAGELMKTQTFK